MHLGVCYYPEHWPENKWEGDARRMAEMGITRVRIAEFAWSRMEPEPGRYEWAWLDAAIATLSRHGLELVLGTPTASPPKWLVDAHPDILPVRHDGSVLQFGSRRHYDISSPIYREHCARIVETMVRRYGDHPAVVAWQTDNELGCHDTLPTYTQAALQRFRQWLGQRYETIAALNASWGNVFWSMEYRSFDEIELPHRTPTDVNPAHALDFRRFQSEEVASFHALQAGLIRRHAPGRDVLHNFMGFYAAFDHYALAQGSLDVAGWDSYPVPRTEVLPLPEAQKHRWARTGHPDVSAFSHDLYRGVGKGRMWVMEQQAGPVNWAPFNPVPQPGIVRLWTWEAFAHGAELVSYFRWRQCPFAQEQMHSGLNTPDDALSPGGREAAQVARELRNLALPADDLRCARAPVALLFDYEAQWVVETQRHGADIDYQHIVFEWYSALRELGLDVDIVSARAELSEYRLVVAPTLPILPPSVVEQIERGASHWVFGPRTGSKSPAFAIPSQLPPGELQRVLPARVVAAESLRPSIRPALRFEEVDGCALRWRDHVEAGVATETIARFDDGMPAVLRCRRVTYVAACLDQAVMRAVMANCVRAAGIQATPVPEGLRLRRRGTLRMAINYGDRPQAVPASAGAKFVLGGPVVGPVDVAAWIEED